MTEMTAADVGEAHVGRYVLFARPRDLDYGNPRISGPLTAVRHRQDSSGREIVVLSVGSVGEVDVSPRHLIDVRHIWREKPESLNEWNIPQEHDPILYAKFRGGPEHGKTQLIGGFGHEWDRRGVLRRLEDGSFAFYLHTHIPEGVERPSNAVQRKHGFGPTVLVGTVHMKYQRAESARINEEETRRREQLDKKHPR